VYGLQLFREKRAPRILLSVARFELRRFARLELPVALDLTTIAAPIPPAKRHFFALIENESCREETIPKRRFGTLDEIRALAAWLHGRLELSSVLVVTGGSHVPRVRLCCQALLPKTLQWSIVAVPPEFARRYDRRGDDQERSVVILVELFKLFAYRLLALFGMLRDA
jgi:hypothetical protein